MGIRSPPRGNGLARQAFQQAHSKLRCAMVYGMYLRNTAWRAGVAASLAMLTGSQALAQYIDDTPPPLPAAPVAGESAGDALGRNVRILAQNPRDYLALVGAGRAALATGDPEAAIGFFGRAADVSPRASAPRAGNGAALVAMGEASRALAEFAQAQRLGASVASFAADRGLARDLLGQQALAQADYRLALGGTDAAEARRRLALSLAISGNRAAAMTALGPLLQHSDVPTNRVRAFVLALGGDSAGASRALDKSVPGMSRSLEPFFRRLPGLTAAQKAAAVNLGIFPGTGQSGTALAGATPVPTGPAYLPQPSPPGSESSSYRLSTVTETPDRLAGIDALLSGQGVAPKGAPRSVTPAPPAAPQPHYEVATNVLPRPAATVPSASPKRIWVQLASGTDEAALASQFARIAAREPEMFRTIRPFVSEVDGRTKLLVGPFKNGEDSEIFIQNLEDSRIDGFSWTSPQGQVVRKLGSP